MTQEYKQLLLKDLSTRLPYGVKVKTPYNDAKLIGIVKRKGFKKDVDYIDAVTNKETYPIQYVQPYLHPISSMTKEEEDEFVSFTDTMFRFGEDDSLCVLPLDAISWLNKKMFDYRGLIKKGLAIEAPEEIYK